MAQRVVSVLHVAIRKPEISKVNVNIKKKKKTKTKSQTQSDENNL